MPHHPYQHNEEIPDDLRRMAEEAAAHMERAREHRKQADAEYEQARLLTYKLRASGVGMRRLAPYLKVSRQRVQQMTEGYRVR